MGDSTQWIITWLSAPRWQRYLRAASNDPDKALALYEWNLQLAAALMHDVAHIEVAVRNSYNKVLEDHWAGGEHWLLDSSSPIRSALVRKRRGKNIDLNERNRRSIDEAFQRLHTNAPAVGAIIAELSFGFWRHLTDTAHEKTLWVPYLSRAFPKGTNRRDIEASLMMINTVRNRASHHEPLFTSRREEEITQCQAKIVDLAQMLLPELATHLQATSTITTVLGQKPI